MLEIYRVAVALVAAIIAFTSVLHLLGCVSSSIVTGALPLDDTIRDIKAELQELENTPGEPLGLDLKDITIVLDVQHEAAGSGEAGLTIPVFDEAKLGSSDKLTTKAGSKITVVLVSPKGRQVLSAPRTPKIEFSEILTAARESLRRAMDAEPKLEAKSIELELTFVLTRERKAGASIKAKVISIGFEQTNKGTQGNTITLKYTNPKYSDGGAANDGPAGAIPP